MEGMKGNKRNVDRKSLFCQVSGKKKSTTKRKTDENEMGNTRSICKSD